MAAQTEIAAGALQELRRAQPGISLAWLSEQMPIKESAQIEHYWRIPPCWPGLTETRHGEI